MKIAAHSGVVIAAAVLTSAVSKAKINTVKVGVPTFPEPRASVYSSWDVDLPRDFSSTWN
jgi:hypothetical protein